MQITVTDTVTVYRLLHAAGKESFDATPIVENLDCQIVPASNEMNAIFGGNPSYALYEIYCTEPAELRNGDKLVSATGHEYILRGVPMEVNTPQMSYLKLMGERVA